MFDKLIDFFLNIIEAFYFTCVIDEYQQGVVLRLGKFHRLLQPGFHFLWPFMIERNIEVNVVDRTWNLGKQGLTTADGRAIVVTAIVTNRIKDAYKAVCNVERPEDAIRDLCYSNIGALIRRSTWAEISAPDFEEQLLRACRRNALKYGMEISAVQLADCCLVRSYNLYTQEPS